MGSSHREASGDRVLVDRSLQGDEGAFASLVGRYRALVHGAILERVRQPEDVEDLVQETFLKMYRQLASLSSAQLGPWLYRIAANTVVDWHRRRERRQRDFDVDVVSILYANGLGLEGVVAEKEAAERLWAAIDRLPPAFRTVTVLYYIEGCEREKIGRFLGISLALVHWRLHQARACLRRDLGGPHRIGVSSGQRRVADRADFNPRSPLYVSMTGRLDGVASDEDGFWIGSTDGRVRRVDSSTGKTVAEHPVGGEPRYLASGGGELFVYFYPFGPIHVFDGGLSHKREIPSPGAYLHDLAWADGNLWTLRCDAIEDQRRVYCLSPSSGAVRGSFGVGRHSRAGATGLAADATSVWYSQGGKIYRVDGEEALAAGEEIGCEVAQGHAPSGGRLALHQSSLWSTCGADDDFGLYRLSYTTVA